MPVAELLTLEMRSGQISIRDHEEFRTVAPLGYDKLLDTLLAKKVNVNFQTDQTPTWANMLISWAPFLLLIDDIVDTGITLSYLLAHIHELGPRSVKVCALIDKPEARKIDVHPDWTAFPVHEPLADRFLVGYGLDWMERFRGLPYIGTIPKPARSGPPRE